MYVFVLKLVLEMCSLDTDRADTDLHELTIDVWPYCYANESVLVPIV